MPLYQELETEFLRTGHGIKKERYFIGGRLDPEYLKMQ